MAIDKTQLEADLDAVIDDDPHVLVIGEEVTEIPCSKSKISREQQYSEYGFGEDYKTTVTIKASLVATIPEKGVNVTLDGKPYQVLDSETDSMDVGLTLHLGTAIT